MFEIFMRQQNPRGLLVLSGAVTPQELSPDPSAEIKGRQDFINKYNNNTETQRRKREPNKQNREDENTEDRKRNRVTRGQDTELNTHLRTDTELTRVPLTHTKYTPCITSVSQLKVERLLSQWIWTVR